MRRRLALAVLLALAVAGCAAPGQTGTPPPYYATVLQGEPYRELVIEIDHAPGRAPGEEALAHLRMTFQNITQKSRVTVLVEASLSAAPQTWTADALVALERETRTTAHAPPTAVLHVLYPAGEYEREGVGGVTIAGPVLGPAVVFLDTLRNYTVPVDGSPVGALALPEGAVRAVERSTLLHEAGHAVGLVDNGLPMVCPHEDPEHEAHSSNPRSVMYYAVDSLEGVRKMLTGDGDVPDRFDAHDLQDIQRAGGRGLPAPTLC